jgi:thiamine pyrophosphate-dependent acetolactate synthase large subunit-like protein
VVTAGPGTTDTVTGVANAFRAQTPMLVIGGQGASTQIHMESLQELDHVGIMKPITKFAAFVQSRRIALREADVILIMGTPFDFRLGYGQRLNPHAKVIQVDLDYGELGHNRDVDLGICGDAAAILEQWDNELDDV